MPIPSRWAPPVPDISLQKWVFGSPSGLLPEKKAFLNADDPENHFITLAQFRDLAKRLSLGLERAGLHPGDRVMLLSGNNILFPSVFMGIVMAGAIFTGASPAFGPTELAFQLKDSAPTFFIVGEPHLPIAIKAAAQCGFPRSRIFVMNDSVSLPGGGRPQVVKHWSRLLASQEDAQNYSWTEPTDPKTTTCCLNYSSGTTGLPKGVEITHGAYVANGQAILHLDQLNPDPSQKAELKRSLAFLPMYHAAGQTTFVVNNPRLGVETYVMAAYNFTKFLNHVQDFKITSIGTAPPVLLQIAKSPETSKYDLSSIRDITCGTAPLAPEIADAVEKKLWPAGDTFVQQGWGMTEVTCVGTLWAYDAQVKSATVGETAPNGQIQIRFDGKEVTEPNTPGELWFSGPTLMKGYWRNPRATADTIVEENGVRWMKTGDFVSVDRMGPGAKVYMVDRLKELIKVSGFQVAPAELEALLLERKDIVDVGVIGVQQGGGEVPRAYVVTNTPKVTEQEIVSWVEERVAKYKRLRGGVRFIDSIPRIPSGKIARRHLKQRAEQEDRSFKAKLS